MKEITRRLLTELADFLDQLDPDRFDYASWVDDDWQGNPDLSCGTAACAGGWATTLPSFRERGLRLVRSIHSGYAQPQLEGWPLLSGLEALTRVLELDNENDARFLFMPEAWNRYTNETSPSPKASPQEVAAHFRRYLESHS